MVSYNIRDKYIKLHKVYIFLTMIVTNGISPTTKTQSLQTITKFI